MDESALIDTFDRLVKSGVVSYNSNPEIVKHETENLIVQFLFTPALAKKPMVQDHSSETAEEENSGRLPGGDIGITVFKLCDIGNDHVLIINKFSFARPHLMLLTSNGYRRQYEVLDSSDIEALWSALNAVGPRAEYVAFYNCGQDGGCSRLHKHMQLMPKPDNTFAAFLEPGSQRKEPKVPFHWFYHRFDDEYITSTTVHEVYSDLFKQAKGAYESRNNVVKNIAPGAACPHNMIMTRNWMVIIPRQRAAAQGLAGANAMGMLGYLAMATREEIDGWLEMGPEKVLKEVGVYK
ncbi:Hypothetical protein R9X50_00669400 [Acrodontium crateriforme]|uniref:ATP adenylyltransferase n=1 Tax=Acrodontium crateriforme TaxID=150365 RepID=A0AAQ3RBQ7_9PEZI|nr:Hypothetical protein R9X50_00669400 [Acrodontium crateriforme]